MDVPIVKLWRRQSRVRFWYQFLIFNTVLLIGSISLMLGYMETAIDDVLSIEEQQDLYHQISQAPELPQSFYDVYDSIYAPEQQLSVWECIYEQGRIGKRNLKTQCLYTELIGNRLMYHSNVISRLAPYIIALELEEKFTKEQCLNFLMSEQDFLMSSVGVEKAAQTYFKKDPADLSNGEVALLIKMTRNPSKYYAEALNLAIAK
jgi:hypothetical protein